MMDTSQNPIPKNDPTPTLVDQVKELTKERDEQRKAADHWMTEACRDHNELQKLIPERDTLMESAKLALEALDHERWKNWRTHKAITALKKAGVK